MTNGFHRLGLMVWALSFLISCGSDSKETEIWNEVQALKSQLKEVSAEAERGFDASQNLASVSKERAHTDLERIPIHENYREILSDTKVHEKGKEGKDILAEIQVLKGQLNGLLNKLKNGFERQRRNKVW